MSELNTRVLAEKLAAATQRLATAENKLEGLLRDLENVERAEKTLVTDPVRAAFDAVRDAKLALRELLNEASLG